MGAFPSTRRRSAACLSLSSNDKRVLSGNVPFAVIALPAGPTILRLLPPLVITEEEMAIGVQAIVAALKSASAAPARRPSSAIA